jgi:nucleoside-triphosphatase THEP1
MMGARIGLLTGPVGVGKTTVAERVVALARRQGLDCGGVLAPAMVNHCGQKVGIWGVDARTGDRRVLARTDRELGGPSIGPYSFDGAALAWATGLVEAAIAGTHRGGTRPCDLLIVDEIGKLELWRGIGLAPILPKLAAGQVKRSLILVRDSLLAALQAQLGSVEQLVFEVHEENRGTLAPDVLKALLRVSTKNRNGREKNDGKC